MISYYKHINYMSISNAINYPKLKKKKMRIDDNFSYPPIIILL